jgi:UPF0716 protein FxsA
MSPVRFLVPGLGFILIILPMIEIALFVVIGGQIGVLGTILAVIATGVIGAAVLSRQGLATFERMNRNLEAGEIPLREVFDGFLMVIAAVLMITPGFATDAIGFLLTVPALRDVMAQTIQKRADIYVHRTDGRQADFRSNAAPEAGDLVIEGELIEPERSERS